MVLDGRNRRFSSDLISTSNEHRIVIRGFDLVDDLIGEVSFAQMAALLATGEPLGTDDLRLLDTVLIALINHGITRSGAISRMVYGAAPDQIQGAVAAGLLGMPIGDLRRFEHVARRLHETANGLPIEELDEDEELTIAILAVPGSDEKNEQVRVARLLAVAEETGNSGKYLRVLHELRARRPANPDAMPDLSLASTVAGCLLEIGVPWQLQRGFVIISQVATLVVHVREEQLEPITRALGDRLKAMNDVHEFAEPA